MCSLFFTNSVSQIYVYDFESDNYTCIEKGPLAGIYEPKTRAKEYADIMDDLDCIQSEHSDKILIYDLIPWCYLYLDRPFAVYSSWIMVDDLECCQNYFEDSNNYPECIYIPYNDFYFNDNSMENCYKQLTFFCGKFDCSMEKGKCGYILSITAE